MKKVIRHSVFETNSSSTHSFSIKHCNPNEPIEENCSFEIRSPLAKVVWLLGRMEIIENDYEHTINQRTIEEDNEIKQEIVELIQEDNPELLEELNNDYNQDIIKNADLIELHDKLVYKGFAYCSFGKSYNYLHDYDELCLLKDLKQALINIYADKENISMEQALENIKHEAFGLVKAQKEKFLDPKTRDSMIDYAKKMDYNLVRIMNENKGKSKEEIVNLYLDYKEETYYKNRNGKISCCSYFEEGSLYDCDCGFDCKYNIKRNFEKIFSISSLPTEEELINILKEFLSENYKVIGVEKYCGEHLIGNKSIY